MFNEEWRDQLFAYLQALQHGDSLLTIDLNKDFTLEMQPITTTYFSDFGYMEPQSSERQDSLIDGYEEHEYYESIALPEKDRDEE